uniref:Uncharacterized protein n=1 Tax=Tanacetum cinerariifolium TaxID=118510 RepID=A0A6L2KAY4_TANCI|nr:hypothetical protein [Tanacetum cinerariifolium]
MQDNRKNMQNPISATYSSSSPNEYLIISYLLILQTGASLQRRLQAATKVSCCHRSLADMKAAIEVAADVKAATRVVCCGEGCQAVVKADKACWLLRRLPHRLQAARKAATELAGEKVVVISSDKVEGSRDWNSPEFQDTANSGQKKETKAMVFYQMDTEEVSDRFVAPCFVNGLEAYDGEINLGVEENMILNEYAVKLCFENEVKRGN